ncbi:hypothetical protein A6M21_09740 [Desulfotomaculum copahuensis]|uniref:Uncharacterized protein n=1 Tax=Desulfotomaculum copahuensis TaxID=1838280 RepID=A0A1B7LEL7_9FIRM|nr:hypothetical protein A6M21_09740 [Desulfotomaculum copahuensis]
MNEVLKWGLMKQLRVIQQARHHRTGFMIFMFAYAISFLRKTFIWPIFMIHVVWLWLTTWRL